MAAPRKNSKRPRVGTLGREVDRWLPLNGAALVSRPNARWVCIPTGGNREPAIALECARRELPFFLPLVRCPSPRPRQEDIAGLRPLWPGYVFAQLKCDGESALCRLPMASIALRPESEDELLAHLRQYSSVNLLVSEALRPGDEIRIVTGQLEGLRGKIETLHRSGDKLSVLVPLFGQSVVVECPIERVDPEEPQGNVRIVPLPAAEPPGETVDAGLAVSLSQINAELIAYVRKKPELLHDLSPRGFESLVAELLSDMGYEVQLTPQTRDGGRDLLAVFRVPHGEILTLVECKKFRRDRKVGIEIVERFLFTIREKDRASCGLIATTSSFSTEARALAGKYRWQLALRDFDMLKDWIAQYGSWARRSGTGLWLPNQTIRPQAWGGQLDDHAPDYEP